MTEDLKTRARKHIGGELGNGLADRIDELEAGAASRDAEVATLRELKQIYQTERDQLREQVRMLRQQLTECQAALALKDEAIAECLEHWVPPSSEAQIKQALAIKPDNTALREWGARLLEAFDDEVHSGNGKAVNRVIRDFRSGKWPPEVLK